MVCSKQQDGAMVPPAHSPPGLAGPELLAALWLRWKSVGHEFPHSAFTVVWDHASWGCCITPAWSVFSSMAITKTSFTMSDETCFPVTMTLSRPLGRFFHKYRELWAGGISITAQTQHFQSMHKKTYLKEQENFQDMTEAQWIYTTQNWTGLERRQTAKTICHAAKFWCPPCSWRET